MYDYYAHNTVYSSLLNTNLVCPRIYCKYNWYISMKQIFLLFFKSCWLVILTLTWQNISLIKTFWKLLAVIISSKQNHQCVHYKLQKQSSKSIGAKKNDRPLLTLVESLSKAKCIIRPYPALENSTYILNGIFFW